MCVKRLVDVIRSYGYDAEIHNVTTDDGYILSLTHIRSSGTKLPVLMMHGLIACSGMWTVRGPGQDLALILVDEGHDVWLGDQRGNVYSRHHSSLNTSQHEFWDFSFHEVGIYDLPALIGKVLQHSGRKQLYYVGHSMGNSDYYVLCSMRPEYNEVIRTAVHLAPVAYGMNQTLPLVLKTLLNNADSIAEMLMKRKMYEIFPRTATLQSLIDFACSDVNRLWCLVLIDQMSGKPHLTDTKLLRNYLKGLQSGTSVKTLQHLVQVYKHNTFSQFDYGVTRNQEIYKSNSPPPYPLERVSSPVALIYGEKDVFVDQSTIKRLSRVLPNVVMKSSIPHYNHLDIILAEDTYQVLFKRIVKLLGKR